MNKLSVALAAGLLALAAVLGTVAATQTVSLGATHRQAAEATVQARTKQLDRFAASLRHELARTTPRLPAVPHVAVSPAPPAAPRAVAAAAAAAQPRVIFRRPPPIVVVKHGAHHGDDGSDSSEGALGGGGASGGGDD